MPAPGTEPLQAILAELRAVSPHLQAAFIVSQDGFTMAAAGGDAMTEDESERTGALSAGLLTLCRSMMTELRRGEVEQVLLRAGEGYLLLQLAGPVAMLAVMAGPETNLGLLLLETERAAEAVARAL